MNDEFLTVAEVAEMLDVSPDTVRRMFGSEPGVIDLGSKTGSEGRRYRILRIPRRVLNRVIETRMVNGSAQANAVSAHRALAEVETTHEN